MSVNMETEIASSPWSDTAIEAVLSVRGLHIRYETSAGPVEAVRGVSFDLRQGETLGIVGESGSGKSTLVLGAVGLLPRGARILAGQVLFQGVDLLRASPQQLRRVLGAKIGIVYQDALRSLNPVMRVGAQLAELLVAHGQRQDVARRVASALRTVGIADPHLRARNYPHEYSGGMRQRAMIGMGMLMNPALLITDEPTTAVDVTVQAQILALMQRLAAEHGTAMIIVSHDLGVIAGMCDRVLVMYGGEVVESAPVAQIFADPKHPYTRSLLNVMPDIDLPRRGRLAFIREQPPSLAAPLHGCAFADRCYVRQDRCVTDRPALAIVAPYHQSACLVVQERHGQLPPAPAAPPGEATFTAHEPARRRSHAADEQPTQQAPGMRRQALVQLERVSRIYRTSGRLPWSQSEVVAVDAVDLTIERGTTLGLVGESGSGKSTLGRIVVGLERFDCGRVLFEGADIGRMSQRALRAHRRRAQMIYQDPTSSLNRAKTIGQLLWEPLRQNGLSTAESKRRSAELLDLVGLSPRFLLHYPTECSGGQAQRIAIARALAVGAELLVADEAVSSLDVSVKGQVLNLLKDLQHDVGLTILFISHDLSVVREICDQVAVMYLGKIVEIAETEQLFVRPAHPYTVALRSAIPIPDPQRERARRHIILPGDMPSPAAIPAGCRFHPRCPVGPTVQPERTICRVEEPPLQKLGPGCLSACHFARTLKEIE